MPGRQYQWADEVYERLAARAIDWREVLWVLRFADPVRMRHVGAKALLITGLDQAARVLTIAMVEDDDVDELWWVLDARYADGEAGPDV